MQAMDILTEHEGIDQQALDDYARLFGQALSDSHIRAYNNNNNNNNNKAFKSQTSWGRLELKPNRSNQGSGT